MNLGKIHYRVKNNLTEIIRFPVPELEYDYILILEIIKNYEKQSNIFDLSIASIDTPRFICFNDYINHIVSNKANDISTENSLKNKNKRKIEILQEDINRIKDYFPNYFSITF